MGKPSIQDIYKGSFKDRPRFDGGGYVDYSGGVLPPLDSGTTNVSQTPPSDAGALSGSGDLSPVNTSQAVNQGQTNQLEAQHNINAINNADAPSQQGALGWLGGKTGSATLSALASILTAAGHMQQAKGYSKLPAMPAMLPGMPSTGTASSGSYGPPGGYNWQNYKGINAGTPGLGFAPRTQTAGKPMQSYYTYGQGPEQQFFQQVQPSGAPITPVPHKKGGKIRKLADGGMMGGPGGATLQAAPTPGMATPIAQQNPAMTAYPTPTNAPPGTASLPARMPALAPPVPTQPAPSAMGAEMNQRRGFQPAPNPMMRRGFQPAPNPIVRRAFAEGGHEEMGALSQPKQSRYVRGPGDGTSDDIPARLANGEYVLSADVVSGLGNGDNNSGAKVLDDFVKNLRTHKAENAAKGKLPADAKPIHKYMGGQ